MLIFEIEKGLFGGKGWKQISFLKWLWVRGEYVTRIRIKRRLKNHEKKKKTN